LRLVLHSQHLQVCQVVLQLLLMVLLLPLLGWSC
jgi:hypothetical protein